MSEREKVYDPDDYIEPDTSLEAAAAKLDWAKNIKTINAYDPKTGQLDIDKTKALREQAIADKDIADVSSFSKNHEWGEDENGLPILKVK